MSSLIKPKSSGRKPSDRKRTRKPDFENAFDWLGKKEKESRKSFMFQGSKAPEKILCEPLFRSVESRFVKRCQGNCRDMRFLTGKEDYPVVKSRAPINFMSRHDKMDSKCCPLYIHFKAECLKEYARIRRAWCILRSLPFLRNYFGKDTLAKLPEEVKVFPEKTAKNVSNNREKRFLNNVFIICRFFSLCT